MKIGSAAEFSPLLPNDLQLGARRDEADGPSFSSLVEGKSKQGMQQKLEAVLTDLIVGQMMPKDMQSFYGAGLAGDIARQMLTQQIADAISKGGGAGLASRLAGQPGVTEGGSGKK